MTETRSIHDRIPTRTPNFLLERLDADVLLYHPGLTKTIRLNETAAVLWELCDGEHTVADIAAMLADAYPEEGQAIASDVEATMQLFASEGAIELA